MSSFTEEGEYEEIDIRNLTPDVIEKLQLTDEVNSKNTYIIYFYYLLHICIILNII